MKTKFSDLAGLAQLIRALAKAHDDAHRLTTTAQGERRAHLAGYSDGSGSSVVRHLNLSRRVADLGQSKKDAEAELAKLLPDVRVAVAALMGDKPDRAGVELLAFMDNQDESALVRCEGAAEFIEGRAGK